MQVRASKLVFEHVWQVGVGHGNVSGGKCPILSYEYCSKEGIVLLDVLPNRLPGPHIHTKLRMHISAGGSDVRGLDQVSRGADRAELSASFCNKMLNQFGYTPLHPQSHRPQGV